MTPYGRVTMALRLLAVDPARLGGMLLRARPSALRDSVLALLPSNTLRLHPAMTLDALEGGVDIAASLSKGKLLYHSGLLSGADGTLTLAMAERTPPMMAKTLARELDAAPNTRLIAIDEGAEADEEAPHCLKDRLAFHVSLDGLGSADIEPMPPESTALDLDQIQTPPEILEEIVGIAVSLGISSLRAPYLALCAAQAHAALMQRECVSEDDVIVAVQLVLAPRATQVPADTPDVPPPQDPQSGENEPKSTETIIPEDILRAAIQTALPPNLLEKSSSIRGKSGKGSGAGRKRIGNRRGRPLPTRDGTPKGDQPRVDLIATLRAALPWQRMRKKDRKRGSVIPQIRPSDLRFKRFQELSDRVLVFVVDASGSAAMARLAEAKGAVEILLSEAYARRDHVSLISFRGDRADLLLPPTRSLVQTKRQLSALPGGGGTPLAAGLQMGLETAQTAERRGLSPIIVLLTDGRSNVALDGSGHRGRAAEDATKMARQIAAAQMDSIVIDCGRRPDRSLSQLALSLRGYYTSLPRADAQSLSKAVSTALDG